MTRFFAILGLAFAIFTAGCGGGGAADSSTMTSQVGAPAPEPTVTDTPTPSAIAFATASSGEKDAQNLGTVTLMPWMEGFALLSDTFFEEVPDSLRTLSGFGSDGLVSYTPIKLEMRREDHAATTSGTRVFWVDQNDAIWVFDAGKPAGEPELFYPDSSLDNVRRIVAGSNQLFTAYEDAYGLNRIRVYDLNGAGTLRDWGFDSTYRVTALAWDEALGTLWVADFGRRIQAYDQYGNVLGEPILLPRGEGLTTDWTSSLAVLPGEAVIAAAQGKALIFGAQSRFQIGEESIDCHQVTVAQTKRGQFLVAYNWDTIRWYERLEQALSH